MFSANAGDELLTPIAPHRPVSLPSNALSAAKHGSGTILPIVTRNVPRWPSSWAGPTGCDRASRSPSCRRSTARWRGACAGRHRARRSYADWQRTADHWTAQTLVSGAAARHACARYAAPTSHQCRLLSAIAAASHCVVSCVGAVTVGVTTACSISAPCGDARQARLVAQQAAIPSVMKRSC